jgi:hypothetical protein
MPSVFVANLLEHGAALGFSDNSDVCGHITEQAVKDLGGRAITEPSVEGNELIARMMAAETIWNATRPGTQSSLNWYTRSIEDMIAVASLMHPEIRDDETAASVSSGYFKNSREARTVFFAAIAITSQNNKVNENMRYALEQYRHFVANGAFDPKSYGANGNAIKFNLERFNLVCERAGGDLTRVTRLLNMKMKMSRMREVAAKYGIAITGSELADEEVSGSIIFGPKIGNGFFQNLTGNFSPITIDLWFMRTWGRYTGTLVRGEVVPGTEDKLVRSLRKSMRSEKMRTLMKENGVLVDPEVIKNMQPQQLFTYCRDLKRLWERVRKAYVAGTIKDDMSPKSRRHTKSNDDASDLKQKLGWPLAAESITQALGYPVDSPKSAGNRKWIREVCGQALEIMRARGYPMTAADMQAILWYPEKTIYGAMTGRPADKMNTSYDQAMIRIAQSEGHDDETIEQALQSSGSGGRAGLRIPQAAGTGLEREPVRLFG